MTDYIFWITLGLLSALISIGVPLVQESRRGHPLAVSIWNKIGVVAFMTPVVFWMGGLPDDPQFYIFVAISAIVWSISDVIYFRTIMDTGAGVVSRLLPSAVILSFVGWFFLDPSLFIKYMQHPLQGFVLFAIVVAATVFAMNLKSCPISWKGIKLIWFVILAAAFMPLLEKIIMGQGSQGSQGGISKIPFAFIFVQALMMIGIWAIFAVVKKPISRQVFFTETSWKTGLLISVFSTLALCARFTALQYVEHPAFLSVLLFTDAFWILLYHRITGRKDHSNIWAGMGIVVCAAALVLVKSF